MRCKVKSTTRRSKEKDTGYDRKKGEVRSFTELYGEVRRGYGEIRYLIFAAVAIFVSVVAASNYPLRISP